MIAFLHDGLVIEVAEVEKERDLSQLEVFGNIDRAAIPAKVVELAVNKQKELPVIIILSSIEECIKLKSQFLQHCFVFGVGEIYEQLDLLKRIKAMNGTPFPVILTISPASLGQDLTLLAFVIQTAIPDSWSIFVQNAGRSNRIDISAPLTGALITSAAVTNIASIIEGCNYKQQQAKLFAPDYLQKLDMLAICAVVDSVLPTF